MSDKLNYYEELRELSYEQLVLHLLHKHGAATDDYFKEKSYERFLKGEIKSIAKGNYSRTKEGLYCHHIQEVAYENLSNLDFIKGYQYPYTLQKKEQLVYSDLVEHIILHEAIVRETQGEFGYKGLVVYLYPQLTEWYIEGRVPHRDWMKSCFDRAFLTKDEAKKLLLRSI